MTTNAKSLPTDSPDLDLRPGRGAALLAWGAAHLRPWLIAAVVVLFAVATFREFHALEFHALRSALENVDVPLAVIAALLALVGVAGMGFYDVIALGSPWDAPPISTRFRVGALSFALSNLVATGPLAGPALRLWLYREAGVGTERIARASVEGMIALCVGHGLLIIGFWFVPTSLWGLGLPLALVLSSGIGTAMEKLPRPARWPPAWVSADGRWPILFLVGVVDWALATAVFLLVLRASGVSAWSSPHAALVFLLGHAAGAASFVPGGLGAADAAWLWGLATPETSNRVAAAILAFRFFYYIVPFGIAGFVLLTRRTAHRTRGLLAARVICSFAVGAAGLLVLVSAATPAVTARLHLVAQWVPLGLIEASHASAALAGALLVVLSRGLRRGFRIAMIFSAALLAIGGAACVMKGGDWKETFALFAVLALLLRHHRAFRRPGAFAVVIDSRSVVLGLLAVFAVAMVALWAFQRAPVVQDLWFRVTLHGEAARALRAFVLVVLALVLCGLLVFLRPRRRTATGEEIELAIERTLAEPAAGATPLMVANGDKLVWSFADRGFVLYATIGNTIVAFGDPLAPEGDEAECIEQFLDFADTEGWEVVLYQVSARWFPHLHDEGFELMKVGEEAMVDLAAFTLDGKAGRQLRRSVNQIEKTGVTIRVIEPDEVRARMKDLRSVSDAWLATKHVAEKQFSVGFFDADYLGRFPVIVAEVGSEATRRIVAFANILPGAPGGEASIDLMRHRPDPPEGIMDALLIETLQWAKLRGYSRFSLGMAPLSTVGESERAPFWERASRLVYRHGEHFYNFRGLRQYKEKFHPHWEPRYMASMKTWDWPRLIATVAALVAGGWRQMILPGASARRRPQHIRRLDTLPEHGGAS